MPRILCQQSREASAPETVFRVFHWILTGNHTFETAIVNSKAVGSTTDTDTAGDAILEETTRDSVNTSTVNPGSALTNGSSERRGPNKLLTGHDNDPLRPNTEQISYAFLRGERIWSSYFTHASRYLRVGCLKGWFAPYTPNARYPTTPSRPTKAKMHRRTGSMACATSRAALNLPARSKDGPQGNDPWNPEHVYNFLKEFFLDSEAIRMWNML